MLVLPSTVCDADWLIFIISSVHYSAAVAITPPPSCGAPVYIYTNGGVLALHQFVVGGPRVQDCVRPAALTVPAPQNVTKTDPDSDIKISRYGFAVCGYPGRGGGGSAGKVCDPDKHLDPCEHDTLEQLCFNVGPASQTIVVLALTSWNIFVKNHGDQCVDHLIRQNLTSTDVRFRMVPALKGLNLFYYPFNLQL